jgi:hypothetical protein
VVAVVVLIGVVVVVLEDTVQALRNLLLLVRLTQ